MSRIFWNRWSLNFGPCHFTVQGKCSRYLSFYKLILTWLEGQPQTNASIWHHNFKEATQNVVLQRWIRLVILCHHQLASTDWEIKITCREFQESSLCGRPKKVGRERGRKMWKGIPNLPPFSPKPLPLLITTQATGKAAKHLLDFILSELKWNWMELQLVSSKADTVTTAFELPTMTAVRKFNLYSKITCSVKGMPSCKT